MLSHGKTEMIRQIGVIPNSAQEAKVSPNYAGDLKNLRDWRNMNNLLVLQSDKNLGTTIVSSK